MQWTVEQARRDLKAAGRKLRRDLARDRFVEMALEKIGAADSDAIVRHWCARICAHLTLQRLSGREYRERRQAYARSIVYKTFDQEWSEKYWKRRQRYRELKAKAMRLLSDRSAPPRSTIVYKTHTT